MALVAWAATAASPAARAQDDEPVPAEATPESGPVEAVPVVGFSLTGSIDPPGRLESLVERLVPKGQTFIPAGPVDQIGTPVSTVGRLSRALERLGYRASIVPTTTGEPAAGIHLDIRLRAYDRIRHIYVKGNWPLRQDEISQRLTLRPGQAIPMPGRPRTLRLDQERTAILGFLRDQGYLDARVGIELLDRDPARSGPLDLVVRIDLGVGYPIGPISVEGNTVIPDSVFVDRLRRLDWRFLWTRPLPFRRSLLREDLAWLTEQYRERGYAAALITSDYDPRASVDRRARHVRIRITVSEKKRVEVQFRGNDRFGPGTLEDQLTLFRRGSYERYEAEASAQALEQFYRSKGHLLARVSASSDGSDPDVHRITFDIQEGPSLKVQSVDFLGNQAFSAGRLRDVVTVKPYPLLGLGAGGYASFRQLDLDQQRLVDFYINSGHPGTTVRCEVGVRPEALQSLESARQKLPNPRGAEGLFIRFVVDEAPLVSIASVRFQSAAATPLPHDAAFMQQFLDAKPGEPLRPGVIRSDGERLARLLGDAGYPEARAEPSLDQRGNAADLRWDIALGRRVRLGPLFVRGNFLTRERTIERWMLLEPGEPLTTTAFERSQRNLALIQIFNNASPIRLPPEVQADDTAPMVVEVEERHDHWGVVRLGAGASTEQALPGGFPLGYYAAVGYEHRNLFGQSWLFATRGELGSSVTRWDSQFTDPRFFGSRFRLNLTADYLQQETVRLGDIRSGGGTIGFAREMFPGVDGSITYGLRNTLTTEQLLRMAGPDADQQTVSIGTVVGSLGLGVEWQRLDNPLVPRRGFKLEAGVDLAVPALSFGFGTDAFVKTRVRLLDMLPLSSRISLRHSVRYDQGFPLGGASLLPKVERLFAGGDTTLRGFEIDRARTEVIREDLAFGVPLVKYQPLGGSLRILQNVDLLFRIAGPWYASVFVDSGIVADSFDGMRIQDFRHGAGIAPLMFRLPIGDFSISWAWPLDPQPGDSRAGRLHLNVGLMF